MNFDILWILVAILALLILVALVLVFKERIYAIFNDRDIKNVKEIVEFKKARDIKQGSEIRATFRDAQANTGRTTKLTISEKNRSFLTIDKGLSERDKSNMMMSFTADHHLKLDTLGAVEDEDPGKYNFDLEKDMPGTYLNTSAKNSTKNSSRKEFFVEFRDRKRGMSSSKPQKDMQIDEKDEREESNAHLGGDTHQDPEEKLQFDTEDGQQESDQVDGKVDYEDLDNLDKKEPVGEPSIANRQPISTNV